MYGRGMMGHAGGRRAMVSYGRGFRPGFPVGLVVGGLFLLFVVGHAFHFFPLFLLLAVPFLLAPALAAAGRGLAGVAEARTRERTDRATSEEGKERELLGALARRGELSPALAALETSLTVAEADRMLSDLAESGHLEVRAREGRIGYALWDHDRRQLTDEER
jgi:MFS family permease